MYFSAFPVWRMRICSNFLFFHHYVLTKFSPCCCLNFLAHKKAKNSLKKIRENVGNIFFFIFCISRLKTRTVALKSCGSFAISCQKFLATTWTTKAKPKMKIMVSWVVEYSVWGILKNKLVGSVLNLQANEQSQLSTSPIHLGWIGCADYLVISKQLPYFFFSFSWVFQPMDFHSLKTCITVCPPL